ncbi:MAG: PKD domain-containing protein, partial [Mariniphaga sp.]|nr:PKD domain-containing protein [Mariniphaga sp.]
SSFGCRSLPGSITLKRKPDFTINASSLAGCIPFTPTLSGVIIPTDTKDMVDFRWDFGEGSQTATGTSVSPTFNEPDKSYTVTLTGKSSITGCPNSVVSNDLKTYPQPTAGFSMDNKIVYNDKPDVKFTDISAGNPATWLWDFGDGVTSVLQNPTYHFVKTGSQRVTLEVSNTDGCIDGISDTVLVAFDRLFPPNGFSPNAPNRIDQVFLLNSEGITPEGYHFRVLSRWNDIVFEAKGEIKGWDGRMLNGTFAPTGAYVWILKFSDFLGRKHQQTGTVTLIY